MPYNFGLCFQQFFDTEMNAAILLTKFDVANVVVVLLSITAVLKF